MGKFSEQIQPAHVKFIKKQHLFFVATAPLGISGKINLSPKGLDGFRVISEKEVGYMDLIGSGNETGAHVLENKRITFMFCSFKGAPNILRLYGRGRAITRESSEWDLYSQHFIILPSTRQLIIADIDLVQTSCGYGVPIYDYQGERKMLFEWADKKDPADLKEYVRKNNSQSIDGLQTDIGGKI